MRVLVVGDCHGVKPSIDQEAEKADLILATGDICGDPADVRDAMFASKKNDQDWWRILGEQKAKEKIVESLEEGREVLEYLDLFGKPVFLVPGNWDWTGEDSWEYLSENRFQEIVDGFSNVRNIDRELVSYNGFSFVGYGPCSAPEIPQYEDDKPDSDKDLEEIKQEYANTKETLQELFREDKNPVLFLSHNVPYDTSLDRIENPGSPVDGRHYGSLIVRELLEDFEPVLSLAGHIHEGYGRENVSETLAVNAGLESYVIIELGDGKIQNIEFSPELDD